MHVGALVIFEGPPPARDEFRAHLEARLRLVPRYRQKLAVPALSSRAGRSGSTTRPSTSTTTCATPRCRSPAATTSCASSSGRIFSQRLDRSKPLWEIWIVQGLEDGRFALISKTHHALVDGVAGVDIATVLFDLSPGAARARARRAVDPDARAVRRRARRRGREGPRADPLQPRRPRARRAAAPRRHARAGARGGRGRGRGRLGGAEPRARRAAQRADRPAPPPALGAEPAGRLQGDQERARRHRERRRAGRGRGRAAPLAARPRRAHGGHSSCARSCRCRSAARTSAARSATASRRCAGRCPCTWTTPSSACAWCSAAWAS